MKRCPLKLKTYPTSPCKLGRNEIIRDKDDSIPSCPWGVADKEANYCLWLWLKQNPGRHTVTKVAEKLNVSTQRVGQIYHRSLRKLGKQAEILKVFKTKENANYNRYLEKKKLEKKRKKKK